jgi:hypothetical protein
MEKVTIEINTENDDFQQNPEREVVNVLLKLVQKINKENNVTNCNLYDSNGNKVGEVLVFY